MDKKKNYLFSAIVGQERLKTAYLANIINPEIGGLLISGPKGTGKSTLVHSIGPLLPEYEVNVDCPFNCSLQNVDSLCSECRDKKNLKTIKRKMRVVNLPLSASEDRLIGTVDIEKLLTTGKKHIQPGILGEANNNILYIDEVNLLPDHIVDDILDVAASKVNTIEREGLSITHASKFVLVGTMNPEEGDLRPQILDRFPLCVKAESIFDPALRVEIVKRNILLENNYDAFKNKFQSSEEALKKILEFARINLKKTSISESFLYAIASACAELKVDGQRPDIIITKTAITLACMNQSLQVSEKDILLAAQMALNHRTRDGGLLEPPTLDAINEVFGKHLKLEIKKIKDLSDLKMDSIDKSLDISMGNYLGDSLKPGSEIGEEISALERASSLDPLLEAEKKK
ncbi:MAG: hypothetical protein A2202_08300 [Bdellovibrionales bacterium RIFOXYA1_FULL_36_14]|nr:MAG: hypothetical protein A2202_08300 [Bdellovibrionales bacterium RIFOXYA1_FULL_36_14]